MRHRLKPWQKELLEQSFDFYIKQPQDYKGKWNTLAKGKPIHIEIGSGKGQFIVQMAKKHPDTFFIAIERMPLIGAYILRRREAEVLDNCVVVIANADSLTQWFEEDEIDNIYLNFSDPWPKKRQVKRRLTYRDFLSVYKTILKEEGSLILKTDNQSLFEFSVVELSEQGWICRYINVNYKVDEEPSDVKTEYEERFSSLGQPIYRVIYQSK